MRLVALVAMLGGGSCDDTCPTDPTDGNCPDGGSTGGAGGTGSTGGGTDTDPGPGGSSGTDDTVPVDVTHTDAFGTAQSSDADVAFDVVRDGLELHRIELVDPATIEVDDTLTSLATGYAIGTVIELYAVEVTGDPIPLDRSGVGTLQAGTKVVLDADVTEPSQRAVETTFTAELLWNISVTATESTLSASWSDGAGGTFSVR